MSKIDHTGFSNVHLKRDIFKSKCVQKKITWIFQDQRSLKKKKLKKNVTAVFKSEGLTGLKRKKKAYGRQKTIGWLFWGGSCLGICSHSLNNE